MDTSEDMFGTSQNSQLIHLEFHYMSNQTFKTEGSGLPHNPRWIHQSFMNPNPEKRNPECREKLYFHLLFRLLLFVYSTFITTECKSQRRLDEKTQYQKYFLELCRANILKRNDQCHQGNT